MSMPSGTRPLLIGSLGQPVAKIGQMPYLGPLESAAGPAGAGGHDPGGPAEGRPAEDSPPAEDGRPAEDGPPAEDGRQYNSAHRLRALWNSLAVPAQLGGAVTGLGGPVLLVDDRLETGWTMTVAARLLRETGAAAVLPLVLAVTTG